jgi:MoaA/NifB/PqqE/SkfB family radical SAM enzyme
VPALLARWRRAPDELSLPEALDLVRQLAALGLKEVTLIGGEVYLYDGWTEVIREVRRLGMQSSLVTGGRGWTIERARAAQQAGVQTVSFSIDGDEATHDRLRGLSGAYRAMRAAIDVTRSIGLPFSVNSQVNRLSMPHLRHVYEVVRSSARTAGRFSSRFLQGARRTARSPARL